MNACERMVHCPDVTRIWSYIYPDLGKITFTRKFLLGRFGSVYTYLKSIPQEKCITVAEVLWFLGMYRFCTRFSTMYRRTPRRSRIIGRRWYYANCTNTAYLWAPAFSPVYVSALFATACMVIIFLPLPCFALMVVNVLVVASFLSVVQNGRCSPQYNSC